jgi:hypothetical protein
MIEARWRLTARRRWGWLLRQIIRRPQWRTQELIEAAMLAAAANWRLGRGIYRFDPVLQTALLATQLNGEIPAEVLRRLPEWGLYIDLDEGLPVPDLGQRRLLGFVCHLEAEPGTSTTDMRFMTLYHDPNEGGEHGWKRYWWPCALPLTGGNLEQALQLATEGSREIVRDGSPGAMLNEEQSQAHWRWLMEVMVPLVLYLCSEEPDVSRRHRPGERPRPRQPGEEAAEWSAWWEVGYRVARALRAQPAEAAEGASIPGRRRRPAPHLRRAHWHLYWTGPRNEPRVPQVRWLSPMLIGDRRGHELPPTVRKVPRED